MCRILVKEKNDAEIELNYFDLCVFFSYLRIHTRSIMRFFTSVYRLLRLPVVAILTKVHE